MTMSCSLAEAIFIAVALAVLFEAFAVIIGAAAMACIALCLACNEKNESK